MGRGRTQKARTLHLENGASPEQPGSVNTGSVTPIAQGRKRSTPPAKRSQTGADDRTRHSSPPALSKAVLAHKATIWEGVFGVVRTLIRSAAWVGCVGFLYLTVRSLAGTDTKFAAIVNAVVDMKLNEWVAYIMAGGASVGYLRERRLRRKTIEQNQEYIRSLEEKIDPRRSSSGLTVIGEPRKEELDAL